MKVTIHSRRKFLKLTGKCAITLTAVNLLAPFLLTKNTNDVVAQIQQSYAAEIQKMQNTNSGELTALEEDYDSKIAKININELRIWENVFDNAFDNPSDIQ